ncbi:MAG: hypothetical protein IJN07_03290 [Clostridia bacterium]|nr:hypothetical protein [Clostridia bacterium]
MKKIVCGLLVFVMLLTVPVTAFAATDTLTAPGQSSDHDVFGSYNETDPNVHVAKPDKGGNFTVDNGKDIIVVDPVGDRSNYKLVVRFFNPANEEAISWIADCVDGIHDDILPFEVFYKDAKGNRVELEKGDKVSVTVDSTDVVLKSVAPDGTVIDVPFTINGGVITFEAPGGKFCYYALAAKSGAVAPPPTNPDTGILFDEVSWFGMMLLCASALGILLLIRKRQLDLDAM